MRLGNTQTDTAPRRRPTRNGVGMRYPFDRRKRSRRRFRAAVAHRRRDGKILYRAVPRRGGRVVDGSGLEIRIQDFALIWTGLDGSVLLS